MNLPALKAISRFPTPLLSNGIARSSAMITSAQLWLAWTQGVSRQADAHIRVEDLSKPGMLQRLCKSTVGNHASCKRMARLHVAHIRRTKGNHRSHPDFSFQELSKAAPLLAKKIQAEGKRLGYGNECFGPSQGRFGALGLAIVPGAAAVPLGNNATARLYHRLPESGNGAVLTAELAPSNATALSGLKGTFSNEKEEEDLCTCGEDANWEQDEQEEDDEDDMELCICVKAQEPGAKELLSAAFQRKPADISEE